MNPPNHPEPTSPPSGAVGSEPSATDAAATDVAPTDVAEANIPVPPPVAASPPPKVRKPGRLKRRAMFGGIAAAIVVLAAMLQGLFDGFGLGAGSGGGLGSGEKSNESANKSTPNEKTSSQASLKETISPGAVIEIRLDDDKFFRRLKSGGNGPRELSIAEIVAAAKSAQPKGDSPRLRIYQRYNAIIDRRDALETALLNSGLKRRDIQKIDEDK